jgi:hypothetical protein
MTTKQRKKMSNSKIGIKFTKEHSKNISIGKLKANKVYTKEERENISKGNRGKIVSEETKNKIRIYSLSLDKNIIYSRLSKNNPTIKMKEKDKIIEFINDWNLGYSKVELNIKYNISFRHINSILTGKYWKNYFKLITKPYK